MSLQKFTSSAVCKSIAAFLFGVMILSACQETAQVVNTSVATETSELVAKFGVDVSQEMQTPTAPLTDEERVLFSKIAADKDFIALRQMHNTLLFKMKIAIGHDKERFKQAIINKDNKTFAMLLNLSESGYAEFSAKFQQYLSNFKIRYAADIGTIEGFKKRNPGVCKSCQISTPEPASDVLDEQLAIIEKAGMSSSTDQIQGFNENECRFNRPDVFAQYLFLETLAYTAFAACQVTAFATFQFWLMPICFVVLSASLISAQCSTCGCP